MPLTTPTPQPSPSPAPVTTPANPPAAAAAPPASSPTPVPAAIPNAAAPAPVTTSTPAAPVKPDGLDAVYWDDKLGIKADVLVKDMAALKTAKAEHDIRMQGVPATPADYKISLDGFTPPEGVTVEIDDKHPLAAPVKDFAHKWQLPQEAMNDLVKTHANYVASEAKAFNDRMTASKATLGANAQARIEAIQTALLGRLGEPGKALVGTLISAEIVTAFEALLRSTSAPAPSAANGAQKPKTDMSKMSTGEKFATLLDPTTRPAAPRN